MGNKLVFLGGGGLACEMLDYLKQDGYSINGYYAPKEDNILSNYIKWLGDEHNNFDPNYVYIIASGLVPIRKKMISFIKSNNLEALSFISSRAWVSSFAKIGKGCFIAPFSAITGNPQIGSYFFANVFSNISHHCKLSDNIVIGPGARVNGHCELGNNVSMGANSTLLPGTIIGSEVEIGINAYPSKKVKDNHFVFAKPGHTLKNKT